MHCQEDITFLDDPNWDQIGSQHSRQLQNAECKCCSDGQMVYFLPHCFLCARNGLRWCEQLQFAFGIMASWHHSWKISSLFSQVSRGRASAETSFVSWGDKKTLKHLAYLAWIYFWVLGAVVPAESSRLAGTHPTINLQQFGCQAQSILRLSVTFLHNTAWIVLTVSGCWGVGVGRTPCSSQIFSAIKFAWQTISHASSNVRR